MDVIIVHYGEIGIKGKNRSTFENKLVQNIRKQLKDEACKDIKRIFGRILITLQEGANKESIKQKLQQVFGIAHFSVAKSCEQDLEAIKQCALDLMKDIKEKTFKVSTKRSMKEFPHTSPEINKQVGSFVEEQTKLEVDYKQPDITIGIEIVEKYAFVFIEKIQGLHGLPVGCSGKVAVMLSGGIDSPVAAYQMLKRGCSVMYIHFHSAPYTKVASQDKAKDLAKLLQPYAGTTKLFLVPFIDIQKEIMKKTNEKFRVILYRSFMVRIAEELAKEEQAQALVTGDNLAQVASQTVENLAVIEDIATIPLLRPLLTFDKQEIINLAKKIGTYEKSIEPHDDCCSLFTPQHPATRATVEALEREEQSLDIESLVKNALAKVEVIGV